MEITSCYMCRHRYDKFCKKSCPLLPDPLPIKPKSKARKAGVYAIYNGKIPVYIGMTTRSFEFRLVSHLTQTYRQCHGNKELARLLGGDGWTMKILEVVEGSRKEIEARERFWIGELGTKQNGFNKRL